MLRGVLYLKGEISVYFIVAWIALGTWVLDGIFLAGERAVLLVFAATATSATTPPYTLSPCHTDSTDC